VGDSQGRIYTPIRSAGGRKVVGSNPTAPTRRKPASPQAFGIRWYAENWADASAVVPGVVPGEARTDLAPLAQ
jgi:hypothetical protein